MDLSDLGNVPANMAKSDVFIQKELRLGLQAVDRKLGMYTLPVMNLRQSQFLEVFGESGAQFFRPLRPLAEKPLHASENNSNDS